MSMRHFFLGDLVLLFSIVAWGRPYGFSDFVRELSSRSSSHLMLVTVSKSVRGMYIECEGWRRHSSLIFLILLFTKPNIEVSGWLYQTKTHFTHIIYQPFSRVSPPSFTLYGPTAHCVNHTRTGTNVD